MARSVLRVVESSLLRDDDLIVEYRILSPIRLAAGAVMRLTDEQARRRSHNLTRLGDGLYQAIATVEFKSGETVWLEDAPPKGTAVELGMPAPVDELAEAPADEPVVRRGRPRKNR